MSSRRRFDTELSRSRQFVIRLWERDDERQLRPNGLRPLAIRSRGKCRALLRRILSGILELPQRLDGKLLLFDESRGRNCRIDGLAIGMENRSISTDERSRRKSPSGVIDRNRDQLPGLAVDESPEPAEYQAIEPTARGTQSAIDHNFAEQSHCHPGKRAIRFAGGLHDIRIHLVSARHLVLR